jgi:hypothetical protein
MPRVADFLYLKLEAEGLDLIGTHQPDVEWYWGNPLSVHAISLGGIEIQIADDKLERFVPGISVTATGDFQILGERTICFSVLEQGDAKVLTFPCAGEGDQVFFDIAASGRTERISGRVRSAGSFIYLDGP